MSGLPGRAHGLDQGTSGDPGGRLAASGLDGIRAEVVLARADLACWSGLAGDAASAHDDFAELVACTNRYLTPSTLKPRPPRRPPPTGRTAPLSETARYGHVKCMPKWLRRLASLHVR